MRTWHRRYYVRMADASCRGCLGASAVVRVSEAHPGPVAFDETMSRVRFAYQGYYYDLTARSAIAFHCDARQRHEGSGAIAEWLQRIEHGAGEFSESFA